MEEVIYIPLQGKHVAVIDAIDYPLVAGFHWYALLNFPGHDIKQGVLSPLVMSRLICEL